MKFPWLHSCSKVTGVHEPVKHSFFKGRKYSISATEETIDPLPTAVCTEAEPPLTTYPAEPIEIDRPIRCPQPEPGIIQDGAIFKERLQTTAKTGEIAFLTENEVHNLLQRREHLSNKRLIFPSASAPEPSITNLISDP